MNERECNKCANYKDTGEGYFACSKWECEFKESETLASFMNLVNDLAFEHGWNVAGYDFTDKDWLKVVFTKTKGDSDGNSN